MRTAMLSFVTLDSQDQSHNLVQEKEVETQKESEMLCTNINLNHKFPKT